MDYKRLSFIGKHTQKAERVLTMIFFNMTGSPKICFTDMSDKLNETELSSELKESTFEIVSNFNGYAPPLQNADMDTMSASFFA